MNKNFIKYENTFKVMNFLMEQRMSRVDLARATGLTTAGIGRITKKLIDIGFVKEEKRISGNIGKPPILLGIVPESVHVVGVGIMRDKVECCLTNAKGKILDHVSASFDDMDSFTMILLESMDKLFARAKKGSLKINAIGIGVPGIVNEEKGISEKTTKFGNFENIPIMNILKNKYKVDVYMENDADMAAMGEKWFGGGIHISDLIYFFIDSGIGAGIVKEGSIYQGEMGYAGEVGHFLVFDKNKIEYFENIYGLDMVLKSAKEVLSDVTVLHDPSVLTKTGNKEIVRIVNHFSKAIASIILSTVNIVGTSNVFIGGKAMELGTPFLTNVKKIIDEFSFPNHKISIQFSHLGGISIPLGAATQAIIMHVRKMIINRSKAKDYT
jgi:predicted NBD/HSP70 family sugar kinase